jgi:hypothetical protein
LPAKKLKEIKKSLTISRKTITTGASQINQHKAMNKKILFIIAVLASAALSARAQNLVANPGFETGDFTGWTQFGDTSFTAVDSGFDGVFPHSGNFQAHFGPFADGGINQALTGPAGTYSVDFWLAAAGGGAGDYVTVDLGGIQIYTLPGSGAFAYTHITETATTGANPLLEFHFINQPSYWFVDDVNVVAVPEPGTLGLIALGGLGLVAALRKRLA